MALTKHVRLVRGTRDKAFPSVRLNLLNLCSVVLGIGGVNSHKAVMDQGLNACFSAVGVISVRVEASLGWVDFDDVLQLCFAPLEPFLPEVTLWFAFL